MIEKELEEKFRTAVKKAGGKAYKFTSPGNIGVPDRLIVFPGGWVAFVELKRPGRINGVTAKQKQQLNALTAMGCDVFLLDSVEGIDRIIHTVKTAGTFCPDRWRRDGE